MRKMKNFMLSGLLLATVSVSAEIPPSIHVDGEYLTDTTLLPWVSVKYSPST